ncbi:MAG TPA: hypothetical protein VF069_26045 [Streptosporangiaceae bacterium]
METNHNFLHAAGQPVSDRMRELLARAAQDHVYEQRSQGHVLDEIRQRLEGMEWLLREVRERELPGKPPEWAESLAEHIEAVGERVKPVAELPALWADVGVIAENVDEGLSRMHAVMDAAQQLAEASRQATERMAGMAKRLDKVQGSMEATSVRFNRMDKSLAELGHRAEKLEHSVNAVTSRVDHSLADVGDRVDQGLQTVGGRLEGVAGRLDGLDGRFAGLSGRLDGVDPLVDELRGHIASALADVAKRVETIQDDLTRHVREVREDVWKRAQSVHEEFSRRADAIYDDLGKKVDGVHEDMLKRLAALEEGMLTLAEALLRPRRDAKD